VIVEAPRSRPRSVSMAAAAMLSGSKPVLVFDRRGGVDQDRRDLLVGHFLAPLAGAEAGQFDGAAAVVDDRFGDELEPTQLGRVGQVAVVGGEDGDRADEADGGDERHRAEEEER